MARGWLHSLRLVVLAVAALAPQLAAQTAHPKTATPVTALLVSDVHFEPFWDPDKVPQLVAAPASQWQSILSSPPSQNQAKDFDKLQKKCKVRGDDTDYTLFASSLAAMKAQAQGALFITISGDLISHSFTCKYDDVVKNSTPQQYQDFVVKTMQFVLDSFRAALPSAQVYAALGNNDSGCGDYQIDPNSSFLSASAPIFTSQLSKKESKNATVAFGAEGDYKAALPAPFKHTYLLILDDLFQGRKYQTCEGKSDSTGANAQIAWLSGELAKARKNHEQVWVMGHIPPGIDPYSSIKKNAKVCGGKDPDLFLSSDDLANTLAQYGDVIKLGIFAHTHMDEMRLLAPAKGTPVAIKMVSSISPVDGNNPSFTIASVDPGSAALLDYHVIAASNQTGVDTTWTQEYDYAQTYSEPSYSGKDAQALIGKLTADPSTPSQDDKSYMQNYFVGADNNQKYELGFFWPQYACALQNYTASSYSACSCAAAK